MAQPMAQPMARGARHRREHEAPRRALHLELVQPRAQAVAVQRRGGGLGRDEHADLARHGRALEEDVLEDFRHVERRGAQGEGDCAIGTTTAEMAAGAAVAVAGAPAVEGADVLWSDVIVAGAGGSSDAAECAICLSEVEECAICLSEMGAGDLVLQLPCGHEFHLACFEGWEAVRAHAKQGRPTCPLCKAELSGSGDRQPAGPPCAEGQTNTVADTGRLAPPTALEVDAAAAASPTAAAAAASVAASSSAVAGGGHGGVVAGGGYGGGHGGGHGGEPSRWSRPAAFRHLGWACSYLP